MKILIIRFSSIGDIVLTTPVIRGMKQQLGAEVHFAVKRQYREILDANPNVDKVHALDSGINALLTELKKENFDYVIDLHNNLRTFFIRWRLGVKTFRFDKLNIKKWLMVNFKINRLPDIHIVDRYLKTAESLGLHNDGKGLDYFISAGQAVDLSLLPASHRQGYVVYAIGGQHATKKLPLDKMIQLCTSIGGPIVLLGGKEDFDAGEAIRSHFENADVVIYNGCGKHTLDASASLVLQSRFVYSHDTGIMHIAAALQKEIFAIWGNTIPAFGMYPYRTKFTNIENKQLSCRPCSKIGFEKCPKGHFRCMRDLTFNTPAQDGPAYN